MLVDADGLADVVVSTIQRALAPVSADVKVLRAQMADRESALADLAALRERVAVIESKDLATKSDVLDAVSAKAIDGGELLALVMKGLEHAA